ncbi:MAG: hypothetical protein ASARMPREDX12_002434 [Alectoria sarmentosa]|nr:MAG: hypothetical protein ASARMPREDX12_002434 [Alectoria sarmentosa]
MGGEMFAGLGNERQPEKDTDFERQAKHKGTIVQEEHMQRQDGKEREVADEVRIQTHREDLERQERMTQQQRITEGEQRNCGRSIEEQSRHEGDVQNQPSEYGRTKSSPIDLWQEPQAPLDNECSDQSFQSSVAEQPKVLEIFHSPPLTTDAVIQRSRSSGIMVDTGHLSVTSPDATALHQSLQTRSKSAPPRAYESRVKQQILLSRCPGRRLHPVQPAFKDLTLHNFQPVCGHTTEGFGTLREGLAVLGENYSPFGDGFVALADHHGPGGDGFRAVGKQSRMGQFVALPLFFWGYLLCLSRACSVYERSGLQSLEVKAILLKCFSESMESKEDFLIMILVGLPIVLALEATRQFTLDVATLLSLRGTCDVSIGGFLMIGSPHHQQKRFMNEVVREL